ncbi:hypothetical protein [Pseudomonas sp. LB3P58]
MDIIRNVLSVGLVLLGIWAFLLSIGLCIQLKQACLNWIESTKRPIAQNIVFNYVLKVLGLSQLDRLTCSIFIINALMLWPLTLVFGIPAVKTFRARERRALENLIADRNEAKLSSTKTSLMSESRPLEMRQ